jgi:hypothetical protein
MKSSLKGLSHEIENPEFLNKNAQQNITPINWFSDLQTYGLHFQQIFLFT